MKKLNLVTSLLPLMTVAFIVSADLAIAQNRGYGYVQPVQPTRMVSPYVNPYGNPYVNRGIYNGGYNGGYAYPWAPTVYVPQTTQSTTSQAPPLSTVFSDLLKYLDEKKEKGKISAADYEHLRRRATDLQTKYFDLRTAADGNIDSHDENQIRKDIEGLGAEVARSVKG